MTESPGDGAGYLAEPQVRAMFDRISGIYDRLNGVMTGGLHHAWRRRAVELAAIGPGAHALDVATGTGDLAFALADAVAPTGAVVGVDFAEQMLAVARAKAAVRAPGGGSGRAGQPAAVSFERANALALPFADGSFDAATVGFGVRNFADLDAGLHELARVVRPGGRVVILEITTPQHPPLSTFFRLWFERIVPVLGRLAGDPEAYSYLPSSVRRFPPPQELARRMAGAGLVEIRYLITAGGIIALHVGTVR